MKNLYYGIKRFFILWRARIENLIASKPQVGDTYIWSENMGDFMYDWFIVCINVGEHESEYHVFDAFEANHPYTPVIEMPNFLKPNRWFINCYKTDPYPYDGLLLSAEEAESIERELEEGTIKPCCGNCKCKRSKE